MIRITGGLKSYAVSASIALAVLLTGCGGGGGGGGDALPTPSALALMVDSTGREVPEAEFGHGDALAAGADGLAFDEAPIGNAQVTLTDSAGITRTSATDAMGYYRLDAKGLRPPFIVKVKRLDGAEWFSAGSAPVVTRGFMPININGLTDKTVGYVADALKVGAGAASAVSAPVLASNLPLLDAARAKLRSGLAVPLVTAGFDPASYDPVTVAPVQASADRHAAFLRALKFSRDGPGRTSVIATINGPRQVFSANAVTIDGAGNLYVADSAINVIRKISPAGVMTTLAGSGSSGFADGAGAAASFDRPNAIALGADGLLYVSDSSNHAIRKVTAAGVVSTLAGGAGGDFVDGVGSAAKFYFPRSIAVDSNANVYVTDYNRALRRVTPAGVVTTIAGYTPQQPYVSGLIAILPSGVAVDAAGTVYFSDDVNRKVVKIAPDGTASDLYQAPAGGIFQGYSLAADASGTVYVGGYNRVLAVTPAGVARTLAGGTTGSVDGNGASARFGLVGGMALAPNGDLLVADGLNNSIRRITANGDVTTVAGKATAGFADGPASSATFSGDWVPISLFYSFSGMGGVAVDEAGDIYLADTGNHAIRRIARSGAVTTVAGTGAAGFANGNGRSASFNRPTAVALDRNGNLYVADSGNNVIRKISPSGDVSTFAGRAVAGFSDGSGTAAAFYGPDYVAVGADGTVYVSDNFNNAIRKITPAGVVSTLLKFDPAAAFTVGALAGVGPLAVDSSGTVLVRGVYNVFAVSANGAVTRRTNITDPWALSGNPVVDSQDNLYYVVKTTRDKRVSVLVRLSPAGVESYVEMGVVPHQLDALGGQIAVDGNGNLVVTDPINSAIRIVLP